MGQLSLFLYVVTIFSVWAKGYNWDTWSDEKSTQAFFTSLSAKNYTYEKDQQEKLTHCMQAYASTMRPTFHPVLAFLEADALWAQGQVACAVINDYFDGTQSLISQLFSGIQWGAQQAKERDNQAYHRLRLWGCVSPEGAKLSDKFVGNLREAFLSSAYGKAYAEVVVYGLTGVKENLTQPYQYVGLKGLNTKVWENVFQVFESESNQLETYFVGVVVASNGALIKPNGSEMLVTPEKNVGGESVKDPASGTSDQTILIHHETMPGSGDDGVASCLEDDEEHEEDEDREEEEGDGYQSGSERESLKRNLENAGSSTFTLVPSGSDLPGQATVNVNGRGRTTEALDKYFQRVQERADAAGGGSSDSADGVDGGAETVDPTLGIGVEQNNGEACASRSPSENADDEKTDEESDGEKIRKQGFIGAVNSALGGGGMPFSHRGSPTASNDSLGDKAKAAALAALGEPQRDEDINDEEGNGIQEAATVGSLTTTVATRVDGAFAAARIIAWLMKPQLQR